tara:strand:+ start:4889 stop:5389 length:501 start_codon:yes stop_codon:yes gene_type:complete
MKKLKTHDLDYYVREVELQYKDRQHWMVTFPLKTPEKAGRALASILDTKPQEQFGVLSLDVRLKPINFFFVSLGSMSASLVHPREVFRTAIATGAHCIIIAHSHPSGDANPSDEDVSITERMVSAGYHLGIHVVDHFIVAANNYYSFREHDRMPEVIEEHDGDRAR